MVRREIKRAVILSEAKDLTIALWRTRRVV